MSKTDPKPQASQPTPANPAPILENALDELTRLAEANKPTPRLRALIAGRPGTGKTHLILTLPRPVVGFYCDRDGGDEDLEKEGRNGVYRIYLRRGKDGKTIAQQLRHGMERITAGDLSGLGIQSTYIDSSTYLQGLVSAEATRGSQISQRDWGNITQQLELLYLDFLTMDQHTLILSHLKAVRDKGRDPETGAEVPLTVWQPDLTPKIRDVLARQVGMMGYTWRRTDEAGNNTFGVNFTESSKSRGMLWQFQDAKAPAGWGATEVADAGAWISRLWPSSIPEVGAA